MVSRTLRARRANDLITLLSLSLGPHPHIASHSKSIARILDSLIADTSRADGFLCAVDEALSNAVAHGKYPYHINVYSDAGVLYVDVSDYGLGFDCNCPIMPDVLQDHGRGNAIIAAGCDSYSWVQGTPFVCRMSIRLQ